MDVAKCECLAEGSLAARDGRTKPFKLLLGWNMGLANRCDSTWGVFTTQLARFIKKQNYTKEQLAAVLAEVQFDDSHWRWLDKSLLNLGDEYKWFFLMADGEPQSACLIYHPKPSAFDGQGAEVRHEVLAAQALLLHSERDGVEGLHRASLLVLALKVRHHHTPRAAIKAIEAQGIAQRLARFAAA
ncbi:MAG: hypothetical protein IPM99_06155 [Rubrivivax sp.]|nr:hypothetical protein [Rubrivivax sp.]